MDLYGEKRLPELVRRLCEIEGFRWIRLHYLYPDEITEELVEVIATEPKVLHYLDLPIQHCNDQILRRMNRRGTKAELEELFTGLRKRIPDLVVRTSLITGLPGEGEAEFEELCQFLRRHKLERVGAFAFCPEEGTPAAAMDCPDSEIAQRRAETLMELQSRIMDDFCERQIGRVLETVCEGYDPETELYFGRTYAESPDIDGRVLFDAPQGAVVGRFYKVQMEQAVDGELIGRVVEEEA